MNLDPLADDYSNINKTPYQYCSNDPINRVDPDGRDDWEITKENKLVRMKETNDKFHRIYKINEQGKKIPFYRTDNKLLSGIKENGLSRIDLYNARVDFRFILELSKNKGS